MFKEPTLIQRYNGLIQVGLLLLVGLIPWGIAAAIGTPDPDAQGWGVIQSRAADTFCQDGQNPMGTTFAVTFGLLAVAWVVSLWRPNMLGALGPLLKEHGIYLVGVALFIAMPFFLAWNTDTSACVRGRAFFLQSVLVEIFILSILAVSYNLLFGFAGIVSFGHAVFFGTGAYLVGIFMLRLEWPWYWAILGALLAGVLIAVIKGIVGLRIRGLYFALFTLAFAEVFFLLAGNRIMVNITGAEDGFTYRVPDFLNITTNRLFFYYLALFMLVFSFVLVRQLMNSPTGQVLRAARDNEERAQMLGFNTFYFKLLAIMLSGLLATGAGILSGLSQKGANPSLLGIGYTFDPLLATIIGGTSTFIGPVVGAMGLHFLEEMLRNTVINVGGFDINIGERWAIILGITFIVIVLAFPQGLVGTFMVRRLNTLAGWRKLLRLEKDTTP